MPTLAEWIDAYLKTRSVVSACKSTGYVLHETYPPAGFYVYALIDPFDDSIFYIGKGIGGRVLKHEERTRRGVLQNRKKVERIQAIYSRGQTVVRRIIFVAEVEEVALAVEADTIRRLADTGLTNIVGGREIRHAGVNNFSQFFRGQIDAFREKFLQE